jgi:hypothetical protein
MKSIPLLLISLLSLLMGCSSNGADTAEQVVEKYLLGLENKDEAAIKQLVPGNYTVNQEIKNKISQVGGRKIQERQISYLKPKPVFWTAKIQGVLVGANGQREKFEDDLSLASEKNRWYLRIGSGNIPAPNVEPAVPQTTPK